MWLRPPAWLYLPHLETSLPQPATDFEDEVNTNTGMHAASDGTPSAAAGVEIRGRGPALGSGGDAVAHSTQRVGEESWRGNANRRAASTATPESAAGSSARRQRAAPGAAADRLANIRISLDLHRERVEKRSRLRGDHEPPAATAGERMEALRRRVEARALLRVQAAEARGHPMDASAPQRRVEGDRDVRAVDAALLASNEDDKIHRLERPSCTFPDAHVVDYLPAATAAAASYESWHTAAHPASASSASGER